MQPVDWRGVAEEADGLSWPGRRSSSSEAPPQCPPTAARVATGWGHLAITSANSIYSGINPAADVVGLLEVKVRYPEKMLSDV